MAPACACPRSWRSKSATSIPGACCSGSSRARDAGIAWRCSRRSCSSCCGTGGGSPGPRSGCSPDRTRSALVGFQGGEAGSRNQACDKGAEQGSPTPARVVNELEEAEIERQLVLRDAPVRAEPGAQQGPEPLDGVDVHLAKAIPVFVTGVFAAPVADRLVLIAPGRQAGVDAIPVGMDERAFGNRGRDDRLDRGLLHVGQHVQDYLTSALDQAENGWLVLLPRAPARRAGQPATAPEPPLLATAAGWPLWPATT